MYVSISWISSYNKFYHSLMSKLESPIYLFVFRVPNPLSRQFNLIDNRYLLLLGLVADKNI